MGRLAPGTVIKCTYVSITYTYSMYFLHARPIHIQLTIFGVVTLYVDVFSLPWYCGFEKAHGLCKVIASKKVDWHQSLLLLPLQHMYDELRTSSNVKTLLLSNLAWSKFKSKYRVHYWVKSPVHGPVQSPRFCPWESPHPLQLALREPSHKL